MSRIGINKTLMNGAEIGDFKQVHDALERGAKVSAEDEYALRAAAKNGHLAIVQYLVQNGANIHHAERFGALPLSAAEGHLPVVQFLVSQGADIHANNGHSLISAIVGGHLPVVEFFYQQGIDIFAENQYPLKIASRNGKDKIVRFLIEKGADIFAEDEAALRHAAKEGHLEVVKVLVENGADVLRHNSSALRKAVESGHLHVAQFLLEKGGNINDLYDVFISSARKGSMNIVKFLVGSGIDIHASKILEANIAPELKDALSKHAATKSATLANKP